jgi:hypothetical protein
MTSTHAAAPAAGARAPRLVTAALIEQIRSEREEQLARVARQLVGDPDLGITQVIIHGARCDQIFNCADDRVARGAPAERLTTGRRAGLRAFGVRLRRRRVA